MGVDDVRHKQALFIQTWVEAMVIWVPRYPADYVGLGHAQSGNPDCAPRSLLRKVIRWNTQQEHLEKQLLYNLQLPPNHEFHPLNQTVHMDCVVASAQTTFLPTPGCFPPSSSIPGRGPTAARETSSGAWKEQAVTSPSTADFISNPRAVTTTTTTATTTPPAIAAPSPSTKSRSLHHFHTLPPINRRTRRRNRRAPRLSVMI